MRNSFGTCIPFCPSGITAMFCSRETESNTLKMDTWRGGGGGGKRESTNQFVDR